MQLHQRLLAWYDSRTREMPWRDHPDPYAVWVSEIMLQQTQVETVKAYFIRFMQRFPTVQTLAAAPQQEVLKAWEGLGYYTRARNLQKAAQQVVERGGGLPSSASAWAELPGVGPYTAAAISSICFGECAPVVDGNVARLFSRFLAWRDDFRKGAPREKLAAWLQPFIEKSKRPGDFNQAMMDLGATICTPRNPKCAECPLRKACIAYTEHLQDELPVKPPRKEIPLRFSVAVEIRDVAGRVLFSRRVHEKLLQGLWELPSYAFDTSIKEREALRSLLKRLGLPKATPLYVGDVEHAFSHFKSITRIYRLKKRLTTPTLPDDLPLCFAEPSALPLTTVTRRALEL
jgi:A/G-specific adenine glycosylase